MGQQQLLLLVLGIVIVGLAVVVGIQAFNESRTKSQIDNYTATGVGMVGEIIAWYQKPTAQGGGGSTRANLATLTINQLGYTRNGADSGGWGTRTGTSVNGVWRYVYPNTTHPFLHIHQDPIVVGATRVEVHAFGPSSECIVSRSDTYGVSATWSDGKADGTAPDNPNPTLCTW